MDLYLNKDLSVEGFSVHANRGKEDAFVVIDLARGVYFSLASVEECEALRRVADKAARYLAVAKADTPHQHVPQAPELMTTYCGHCGLLPRDDIHEVTAG